MASRRRPWLAALLTFLIPGIGHLYAGRVRRAVLLLVAYPAVECVILVLAAVVGVQPANIPANILVPAALTIALRTLLAQNAARTAHGFGAGGPVTVFSRWYWCVAAVVLVAAAVNPLWRRVLRTTFVEPYKIPTGSMEDTILRGDHLLAVKWAYGWRDPVLRRVVFRARQPARGELVVFLFPEDRTRAFLMRLIGLPGETVEIRDKRVFVNREPLDEPYAHFLELPVRHDDPEYARSTIQCETTGGRWRCRRTATSCSAITVTIAGIAASGALWNRPIFSAARLLCTGHGTQRTSGSAGNGSAVA